MNCITKIILTIHRITGSLIAVFFLMWFFTGLVLLYHDFPRISQSEINRHMSILPDLISLPDTLPSNLKSLNIRQSLGQTVISFATADTVVALTASGESLAPITFTTINDVAHQWNQSTVSKIDTLTSRDQWIMYSRYEDELPIYKYYFNDDAATQMYIASRTAEPLQITDKNSRIWAWIGAIPHKLYFPFLRSDVGRWKLWLLIGASICLIASLSGVIVALLIWRRHHRNTGHWKNPFHSRLLRWHFSFGLIFAIPLVAWSISGIFSMQRVPTWLVPMEGSYMVNYGKMWGRDILPPEAYKLSLTDLKKECPGLKSVTYGRIGDIPIYTIIDDDSIRMIDASSHEVRDLFIPETTVMSALRNIHGDSVNISLNLIDHYDSQYYAIRDTFPLPVYRARISNQDETLYYIDPHDGHITYLNRNKLWRKYLFSGIHYLNLRCFSGHEYAWKMCMWTVCLCGVCYCFISVILGIKYVKRNMIRIRRPFNIFFCNIRKKM